MTINLIIALCAVAVKASEGNASHSTNQTEPALSFKAMSDQWLKDIHDYFEREWNYTLTQPSMTSFDHSFV